MLPEKKLDDVEIIKLVREDLIRSGKKLTNAQGLFFLSLIDYAMVHGSFAKTGDCFIFISEDDMVDLFGFGKSFVNNSLSIFHKAAIIERKALSKSQKIEMFGDPTFNVKATKIYRKYFVGEK